MIGEPRFVQERLGRHHDRAFFSCSREPALHTYFTDSGRAIRENERNISAVYVLLDTAAARRVSGFFTISNATVIPSLVPSAIAKRLPQYDSWGCVKLGRMARDDRYQKHGLGPILIARAFAVALSISEVSGSFALIVDAKNDSLAEWYRRLGFQRLVERSLTLFVTNATMAAYLERLRASGL